MVRSEPDPDQLVISEGSTILVSLTIMISMDMKQHQTTACSWCAAAKTQAVGSMQTFNVVCMTSNL